MNKAVIFVILVSAIVLNIFPAEMFPIAEYAAGSKFMGGTASAGGSWMTLIFDEYEGILAQRYDGQGNLLGDTINTGGYLYSGYPYFRALKLIYNGKHYFAAWAGDNAVCSLIMDTLGTRWILYLRLFRMPGVQGYATVTVTA